MYKTICLLVLLQLLRRTQAGVLIWGSESIELPSLKQFNNEDFDLLKSYMRRPKVVVFRGDPMAVSSELQALLRNKYTAYVPNSSLNVDGAIELNGDAASNFKLIQATLEECSRENDNILALILSKHDARPKREVPVEEAISTSTEATPETEVVTVAESYEPATGPVLYRAEAPSADVAMVYSSRTPALRINATTFSLGKAAVATVDDRGDKYRQLSVAIPMESGDKVTLRFRFVWRVGYWSLGTVHLLYLSPKTIALAADGAGDAQLGAARNFSYHCSGAVAFRDEENEVELTLFDVQAQPDARATRFGDAFDCVYFTTAPIWSGLFVVALLLIGLSVGLGALSSIKTMDKFDNSKTKQLTITASE